MKILALILLLSLQTGGDFAKDTNFMSDIGYKRWNVFKQTGTWIPRNQVQ